jgi:cytochrome oxidase Cu insertion factor (SCO1/SenC/PrrC family)
LLTNFLCCTTIDKKPELHLPFLGEPTISGNDTIPPTIKSFSFIDQDSNVINNLTFSDKIYVADFIFLSCPSICPKMNKDSLADGGFTHTGGLLLIDKNRHIRGVYDGTNDLETNRLINDIWILLKE